MCGDYHPVNRKTKSDRYFMPILEELFDAIGFSRGFNTLRLRSGYHQLPFLAGDPLSTAFWGVKMMGMINCIIGSFFHLVSRMRLLSFR